MGGGDKTPEGFQKLQIQQAVKKDPETEARQAHLWNEAQRFASTGPFQHQYGTAPGMTQMSQRGQQFLTDAILGEGAYKAQDLGFKPWERPEEGQQLQPFQYRPHYQGIGSGGGGGGGDRPPPSSGPNGDKGDLSLDEGEGMGDGADQQDQDRASMNMSQMPSSRGQPDPYSGTPYAGTGLTTGLKGASIEELMGRGPAASTDHARSIMMRQQPPMGEGIPTPPTTQDRTFRYAPPKDFQAQQRPQAERSPLESYQQDKLHQAMIAPDLPGGVGIGETQEAATAMRGLLAQQAPQDVRAQIIGGPQVARTDVQTQEDIVAQDVAGPAGFDVDEFGGASFLGGPSVEDYLQPAAVEAQVAQAQQDYERALAQEKDRAARAGAFGSRGSVEEAGLREAQLRNIAQIRGAGFERAAQMMEADTARRQQAGMQQQQLTQQQRAQTQQLGAEADLASARNRLSAEQANLQAAMASGDRQAIVDAQRNIGQAEMGLQAAQSNQQAALQAAELSQRGLQQYGQQQMDAARGLAGTGAQLQQQTYGAGQQLTDMGAAQEQQRLAQQAFDYEQFLRMQDPAGLQLVQSMMPGGQQQMWQRKPSKWGQIAGGVISAAGTAGGLGWNPFGSSDIRLKENIHHVGEENGFRTYEFNYLGSDQRYKGVMAQEVMKTRPDAVIDVNGLYWVNYGAIGVQMEMV